MSGVTVALDRPRRLRLHLRALADLHKAFGIKGFDPNAVLARFQSAPEPEDFGVLLWALARDEDPELTPDKANQILTLRMLPRFVAAFGELVAAETAETEPGPPAAGADAAAPTTG